MQSLVVSLVLTRLDFGNSSLAGLPGNVLNRLQSLMNAAARVIFAARKIKHITRLLREPHRLRVRQRIDFKLDVLAFRCLHGTAPSYLDNQLQRVADIDSRQRLRSASTMALVVPQTCHSTIGDRAFCAVWNDVPHAITSSPSL